MKWTKKQIIDYLEWKDWIWELKQMTGKKLRTYKQVKYYFWVMIDTISDKTWYMPLEINEQNKILFKKDTFTDLSPKEFEQIMSLLRQFYNMQLNLSIPKPNEEIFNYD